MDLPSNQGDYVYDARARKAIGGYKNVRIRNLDVRVSEIEKRVERMESSLHRLVIRASI